MAQDPRRRLLDARLRARAGGFGQARPNQAASSALMAAFARMNPGHLPDFVQAMFQSGHPGAVPHGTPGDRNGHMVVRSNGPRGLNVAGLPVASGSVASTPQLPDLGLGQSPYRTVTRDATLEEMLAMNPNLDPANPGAAPLVTQRFRVPYAPRASFFRR